MKLDRDAIAHALRIGLGPRPASSLRIRGEIEVHEELPSTSDTAAERGRAGSPEGLVVFAESQRAGRGRKGRTWTAPAGANLLFSVLLRPGSPIPIWSRLAHVAGLAVARGIDPWLEGARAELKWPNDIYVHGRKICGILLESSLSGPRPFLVLGIGINVNALPSDFPPGLAGELATLREFSPELAPIDRNAVAGSVLAELNLALDRADTDFPGLLEEIARRSCLLGRRIRFQRSQGWETAEVTGLGPNGELLVRHQPGGAEDLLVSADWIRLDEAQAH